MSRKPFFIGEAYEDVASLVRLYVEYENNWKMTKKYGRPMTQPKLVKGVCLSL